MSQHAPSPAALALTCALACATATAQAGEVYTGIGLPGLMIGYAHPVSPSVTLRADWGTLGRHRSQTSENGVDYDADFRYSRFALVADWFFTGRWRLTGGLTANQLRLDMVGKPTGTSNTIDLGGNSYAYTTGDRFDAKVRYPTTTPYIGIGYGHQAGGTGWGFHFDVGASIGRAKVTTTLSGPSYAALTALQQAQLNNDLERESQELRDNVGKVQAVPQLSVGVSYRF